MILFDLFVDAVRYDRMISYNQTYSLLVLKSQIDLYRPTP